MKQLGKSKIYAVLFSLFLMSSCASIIHGTKQDINISSSPSGATIYVNADLSGITPKVITLKRKTDNQIIKLELDGYHPYEVKLERKTDGWFWGNILLGGLIGMIVDASNGAMYKLDPDIVSASLSTGTASVNDEDGVIYFIVQMTVDDGLEKIGQLTELEP